MAIWHQLKSWLQVLERQLVVWSAWAPRLLDVKNHVSMLDAWIGSDIQSCRRVIDALHAYHAAVTISAGYWNKSVKQCKNWWRISCPKVMRFLLRRARRLKRTTSSLWARRGSSSSCRGMRCSQTMRVSKQRCGPDASKCTTFDAALGNF